MARCATSARSSMGSVVMVRWRFIVGGLVAALSALHGREQRHFVAVLQHVVAALILDAHRDKRRLAHWVELWEARREPLVELLDAGAIGHFLGGRGGARQFLEVGEEV